MMNKVFILVGILLLALAGFALTRNSTPQSNPSNPSIPSNSSTPTSTQADQPKIQVIAKGLSIPWAIAFLPDGGMLVTERAGRVRLISAGKSLLIDKDGNLKPEPIATITEVKQIGEGGLLGIALHPEFVSNHYVFLYYTYGEFGNRTLNRVSRFTFDGNSFSNQKIIVDKIPGAANHDGGRIKFGPDKLLYITTGDAANPSLSQNKDSLAGKILRVTDLSTSSRQVKVEVYSYGHRNPQGITWDSQGRLWEVEHGQSATDELNLIEPGKNYGWPEIRGDQSKSGMEQPIVHSGSDTWAPAGAVFYHGSVYFGGLRGQALFQYVIDTKEFKTHLKGEFGRIRDVVLGPDNMLYITTSNKDGRGNPTGDDDRIIRINPE